MEKIENKNIFLGNLSWILEAFKTVNKDINFDTAMKNDHNYISEIKFYECLIFNRDREDSVYVQIEVFLFKIIVFYFLYTLG
jgi:hypothetical protein